MENLVFTQLSIPEIRQIFRQELETYFATHKQGNTNQPEHEQLLTVQQAAETDLKKKGVNTCSTCGTCYTCYTCYNKNLKK
jgi:hypothetical protein